MNHIKIRSALAALLLTAACQMMEGGESRVDGRVVAIESGKSGDGNLASAVIPIQLERECRRMEENTPQRKYIPCIYDMPYSITANYPHYKELWQNTGVLFGAGFLTLGVLELLPEDATAWNKAEIHKRPVFERWWHNVKSGPVWDKDNPIFNYVLHPYGGAAYYMSARSQGFNMFYSFFYGFGISTFFWEYGIEAFMEIPSIQDLFVTPIGGLLLGETFYRVKRHIVEHDYQLLGSRVLGTFVAFLVDPVNEVVNLVRGNPAKGYSARHQSGLGRDVVCYPHKMPAPGGSGIATGFTMAFTF